LLRYQSEPPNPLFLVCEWGFANVFETISGNVDFNLEQLNVAGISPIYLACQRGHYDVVLLLLEYGADIDATSHHPPRYALYAAAKSGHYDIVSLLLQRGASVVGDPSQTSPLAAAAEEGHFAIFKLLFERGADRRDYRRAFASAIRTHNREIIDFFFDD
jgi:ankyrin repeat protein